MPITNEIQLLQEVDNYKELLADFKVKDQSTLTFALQVQKDIRALIKFSNEYFKPEKRKCDEEKDKVLVREKAALKPLQEGDKFLGTLIDDYSREQRRKEAEQQRLLEIENVKEAELKKKALDAQAEKEKEAGNTATADLLGQLAQEVSTAPAIIPTAVPSSIRREDGGVSNIGVDYDIAITNERIFVQAVAKEDIPLSCIKVTPMLREFKDWIKQNKICPEGGSVVYKGVEIKERTSTKSR